MMNACNMGNRIITFHAIDAEVDGDRYRLYNMSKRTFVQHVEVINNLTSVSSDLQIVRVGDVRDRTLAISFDDGYSSTLEIAAPHLLKYQMPFSVFVTPVLVDSGDARYLDRSQLLSLAQFPGVTIGAHSYRHVPLSSLTRHERRTDLLRAKSWLEDLIQRDVTSMSYPFGDVPESTREDATEAGYQVAAGSEWGSNTADTDQMMLRRIDLWAGDSRRVVANKINGHWDQLMNRS